MLEDWRRARNATGDIDLVLYLVKKGISSLTRGKKNMDYPFIPNGEQRRKSERERVESADDKRDSQNKGRGNTEGC